MSVSTAIQTDGRLRGPPSHNNIHTRQSNLKKDTLYHMPNHLLSLRYPLPPSHGRTVGRGFHGLRVAVGRVLIG
jgi:hypothetical protein